MKNTIGNFDLEAIPRVTLFLNHYSFLRLTDEKFFDNVQMEEMAANQQVKIHIDGSLLVRHLRMFGVNVKRYSFDWSSIAAPLFSHLSVTGETISFIGGTNAEAKRFRKIIAEKFPRLGIECYNGYEESGPALLKLSQASEKGYVVLGMGTPLQEKLALDLSNGNSSIRVLTCGGFITQTAQFGDIYGGAWRFLPRFVVRAIRQRHVVGRIIKDYPKAMVKATVCGMLGQNIFGTKS